MEQGIKSKKGQKEYDKFMNKQFNILKGHQDRCTLRCYNKFWEIVNKEVLPKN